MSFDTAPLSVILFIFGEHEFSIYLCYYFILIFILQCAGPVGRKTKINQSLKFDIVHATIVNALKYLQLLLQSSKKHT